MDGIFSLLWNRAATHSGLSAQHPTAQARIPINMRGRLNPPVPASYMGNTVATLTASLPSASLSGPIAENLPLVASTIRAAIKQYGQRDFAHFIGTANALPPAQALVDPTRSVLTPSILLNDHSKLGIMSYSFGALGKVERLRDAVDDLPVRHLNIVRVLPRWEDGSLEVVTMFDHEVNKALEQDAEFLEFFRAVGDGALVL